MSKTNETGHAVNVGNFGKLLMECEALGDRYQPSNPLISVPSLKTLLQAAEKSLKHVQEKQSALQSY